MFLVLKDHISGASVSSDEPVAAELGSRDSDSREPLHAISRSRIRSTIDKRDGKEDEVSREHPVGMEKRLIGCTAVSMNTND